MIEIDLYTLAKEAPESFERYWGEIKKEWNLDEEHKEIFKTVYCHGYCKSLDEIVSVIQRQDLKPQAVC